jgi:hypothetical protein
MRVIPKNKWNNLPPDKKKSYFGFIRNVEGDAHVYEEDEKEEYEEALKDLKPRDDGEEPRDKRTEVEKDLEEEGLFLMSDFPTTGKIINPLIKLGDPSSILTNEEITIILRDLCNK